MSMWTRWLNRLNGAFRGNRRLTGKTDVRKRPRQRLGVESLEVRTLLSASVWLDKSDYVPGSTAVINGSGFQAGEVVQLQVVRTDGQPDYPSGNLPWQVTDGDASFTTPFQDASGMWHSPDLDGQTDGKIQTTWYVERQYEGASLELTATGQTSSEAATADFTDSANKVGAVALLHQTPTPVLAGNTANYTLTITRADQTKNNGGNLTVNIVFPNGLPTGATYNGPTQVSLPSKQQTITVSASITTASTMAAGSYSFSIEAARSPTDYALNTATLIVGPQAVTGPTAVDDTYAITADSTLTGNVLTNDTHGTSTTLTVTSNAAPTNGTVTHLVSGSAVSGVASDGSFIYTPNTGFSGVDTFTYTITDGNGLTNSALVTISVGLATTTTTVTASPSPSVYGQTVTFTATVSGAAPTGSVTFNDTFNGTTTILGIGTLNGSGVATLTVPSTSPLTGGSHSITAVYGGNSANGTSTSSALTQTIAPASLTVTVDQDPINTDVQEAFSRVYGDADPTFSVRETGFVNGETASVLGGTLTFSTNETQTSGVGTYTISASGLTSSNYDITYVSGSLNVTKRAVTITADAKSKTYGDTDPALTFQITAGNLVNGDSFSGSLTRDAGENVGSYASTRGTLALSSDYSLTYVGANLTVNQKQVLGSFTAGNKVYDGTSVATISGRSLTGVVGTDDVSLGTSGSATFDTKDVGTGKTVTGTGFTLAGTTAGNYTLASSTLTTTADITALHVTGSFTASNKVYDGNTSATVLSHSPGTVVFGDNVSLTGGTASFNDKTVGTGKTVTLTGAVLSGSDAGNYVLDAVSTTTADVTVRVLTVSATGVNKVYDGTANATVSLSDDRVSGDVFSDSYADASFADKNVGSGKAVSVSGISLSGTDAGNYTFNSTASTTADVTVRVLTVSATGVNKVYDGTANATVSLSDDRVSGDVFSDSYADASFADKNVGSGKAVSVSGISLSGTDAGNYTFNSTASTTADVTVRVLTVSATGVNKVYDGTANATVSLSDDRVSGDVFSDSYADASFADKNVGSGKAVSVSGISLSGTDAGNYTFNSTASTTADVTVRVLTVSATGVNKVYDGTANATVSLSDDRVSGDVFSDSYADASFADKNVGSGKAVSVSGISLSGTDAGNYTFNSTASTTADVTVRVLTVSATGVNKVYDGTANATVSLSDDRVSGDVFSDSYADASFADKNVGSGKAVSVSGISLSGTDAGNYTFNSTASTTADVTVRVLTVSATGVNKVYDGTANATVSLSDDRVSGDVFSDSYADASFADKNVGSGKAVSVSGISLSGTDAGNYTFNSTASTTADVTPLHVAGSFTASNKVYDGNTSATVLSHSPGTVVFGDNVSLTGGTASFNDKTVGTGKTVTLTGAVLSGSDAGNYVLDAVSTTTADVTVRVLTVSATGVNKVYDGTANATVSLSDDRVSGDVFSDSYADASFADKNVGSGKAVSVSGISLSGTDAGNYTFNSTASTTADVTVRVLTVSATGVNKVYDGTANATVSLSDDRVSGDVFSDSYADASFADKNVGSGKAVSVSGISLSGTDAGNYTFNSTASTTADVTVRVLTVSATGVNKVYDGTANATVSLSDDRVSGDVFSDSYADASFADKNVGSGKAVSVSGISLSGTDAGNYTFNSTASTTADITPLHVAGSFTASNKVYDGNTSATVLSHSPGTVVFGDNVSLTGGTASFNDKTVGTGKTVTLTGAVLSGSDAGNYVLDAVSTTTADITPDTIAPAAPPVPDLIGGTNNATNENTPSFSGTAEPNSTVTLYVDGVAVGTTTANAGGAWIFTVTHPLADGNHLITVTATDLAGNTSPPSASLSVTINSTPTGASPVHLFAVGAGPGSVPEVKVYNADGSLRFDFLAYAAGFRGGVRVATGDVTGDGVADIITSVRSGGGPHVKVFDGVTGAEIASFFAYAPVFQGGVSVAAGDVDGDGHADIITGAGPGGGPHVKVFSGADGSELRSFMAYDPSFAGGVRVAAGDISGDGRADVVTVPLLGPTHVRAFDGATGAELASFLAYGGFTGGASVAVGDVDGDGRGDIITGAGSGGGPHVKVFSGADGSELRSFMAFDPSFAGGVEVGALDANGDGRADLVAVAQHGPMHVRLFDGLTLAELDSFFAFNGGTSGG